MATWWRSRSAASEFCEIPATSRANGARDHHRSRIAVAIGGPTNDDALRAFDSIQGRAGIAEIRVDLFSEPADLGRLLRARPCSVVVTCRASIEGGRFGGSEAERLDVLRQAASLDAEYVDVERFAFHDLGPVAPTRVIVSQHDFDSMPIDLPERWAAIRALGADVVKVAGIAADAIDLLPTLNVLANADVPTIAMAMGAGGVASRLLALRYEQCLLSYASLDGEAGTAPGQISLSTMHEVYRAGSIDASTRAFGLIAPSIKMETVVAYNRLLQARDFNAVCVPLQTARPTLDFIRALVPHGFDGFHIHGPGQQSLAREIVDSPDGLNSFSLSAGQLVAGHVTSPEDQVDRWLSL